VIDVLASAPHFADHLAAVFGALPVEARGLFMAANRETADRVRALGYQPVLRRGPNHPVLAPSHTDLVTAAYMRRSRIALMEHGSGQSYHGRPSAADRHGSYAGGMNRGAASLFLHPGPHPAAQDARRYPAARVEIVGSPLLDSLPRREGERDSVIAYSAHFNTSAMPEGRNAFGWIMSALLGLRDSYRILGHAHPRIWPKTHRWYKAVGIEPVESFEDVCRRADLYICDNSSTLFAFAATGRPVVVLNPPQYDRRVNHGLRFWDAADVGVNCNSPADLAECVAEALRDRPAQRKRREAALDLVYAYRTGAAQRAADVLMDWAA